MAAETATLGIWTIARFAALFVLASETLFLRTARRDAPQAGPSRLAWAVIPALILAGLCLWCSASVLSGSASPPSYAQLAR